MKTIALNMICKAKEMDLVARCLKSFDCNKLFDEVVIGVTVNGGEMSPLAPDKIAGVPVNVLHVQWDDIRYPLGNFAKAREEVRLQTKSDYIMWLDSDDLLTGWDDKVYSAIRKAINHPQEVDMFLMAYDLGRETGEGSAVILRERVFRNRDDLRWDPYFPVHEQIECVGRKAKRGMIRGCAVMHSSIKDTPKRSLVRNVTMLEQEVKYTTLEPGTEKHDNLLHYLCRDRIELNGFNEDDARTLSQIIARKKCGSNILFISCMMLARNYIYAENEDGRLELCKDLVRVRKGESFCRISLSFEQYNPEPYIYLGDVYWVARKDCKQAEMWFKKALSCKGKQTGAFSVSKFYDIFPMMRLCQIYRQVGELEEALAWNQRARKIAGEDDTKLINIRKEIVQELCKTL